MATLNQLPMANRNFAMFKTFAVVCTTLLYVTGCTAQSYSSGRIGSSRGSGIIVSHVSSKQTDIQPAHFTSSQWDDEKVPPASSNRIQQQKSVPIRELENAPESCPSQFEHAGSDSYPLGTRVSIAGGTVYECVEYPPCMWISVGYCEDGIFRPSPSTSQQQPTLRPSNLLLSTTAPQMDTTPSNPPSSFTAAATDIPSGSASSPPTNVPSTVALTTTTTTTSYSSSIFTTTTQPPSYVRPLSTTSPSASPNKSESTPRTPTTLFECVNPDPQTSCGCASASQTDYRGSINTTKSGVECIRWDEASIFWSPERYPNAGLDDNNFCRNPTSNSKGAWCATGLYSSEPCDISTCEELSMPLATPAPSSLMIADPLASLPQSSSSLPMTSPVSTIQCLLSVVILAWSCYR